MLAKPLVSFAALTMFVLATPAIARAAETPTTHSAHAHHATSETHVLDARARSHGAKAKAEAAKAAASKPKAETHVATKTETKVETKTETHVETKGDAKAAPAVAMKPAPAMPSAAEITLDEIRAALAGKRSDHTTLPDLPASVSVPMENDNDAHDAKAIESDPHGKTDAKANEKAEKKVDAKSEAHASERKHGAKLEAPRVPAKSESTEPGQKRKRDTKAPARGHRSAPKPSASGASV